MSFPLFLSLCQIPWARLFLFLGQAWAEGKRGLQRAATALTADRKTGQNVRRHDLYRSNASMIKQKKNRFPHFRGPARQHMSPAGDPSAVTIPGGPEQKRSYERSCEDSSARY